MKAKILSGLAVMTVLLAAGMGRAWADDDNRAIGKFDQTGPHDHLSTASVYLTLKGDKADGLPGVASGDETRFYTKVLEGLYLQVTTETGEVGTQGYMFSFSKDEGAQDLLKAGEPSDVPTLREVSAADFRTDDNFGPRPLKAGPGIPKDRSAFRAIHYPGFDAEIRVLEFSIGDAKLGKKPYFKSLSCLVTVKENKPMEKK